MQIHIVEILGQHQIESIDDRMKQAIKSLCEQIIDVCSEEVKLENYQEEGLCRDIDRESILQLKNKIIYE